MTPTHAELVVAVVRDALTKRFGDEGAAAHIASVFSEGGDMLGLDVRFAAPIDRDRIRLYNGNRLKLSDVLSLLNNRGAK